VNRRNFFQKAAVSSAFAASSFSSFGNEYVKAIDKAPKSSAPSDLKITDLKAGYIRGGHSLFVKIYTNQDIIGHGEGVDATPGTYHLVKSMGQRLKGQNPLNVNRLFEQIRKSGFFEGVSRFLH